EEQALARAVEHNDFGLVVHWPTEVVTLRQPGGGSLAKAFSALVGRIPAEIVQMRLQHRSDERWNRMLRLADRKIDRRLARLDVGQELVQPHERRAPLGLDQIGWAGICWGRGGGCGHCARSALDMTGRRNRPPREASPHHTGGEVKA